MDTSCLQCCSSVNKLSELQLLQPALPSPLLRPLVSGTLRSGRLCTHSRPTGVMIALNISDPNCPPRDLNASLIDQSRPMGGVTLCGAPLEESSDVGAATPSLTPVERPCKELTELRPRRESSVRPKPPRIDSSSQGLNHVLPYTHF